MSTKKRIFVGVNAGKPNTIFRSYSIPTFDSHGHLFGAVIGPFNTLRGAKRERVTDMALVYYVRTLAAVESRNPDVLAMYERAIFDAIRNFADGN